MTILSNTQAVAARAAVSLSQSRVAKDTGISRAYLSQFESGKRILEDRWLTALNSYYREHGWSPEAGDSVPAEQQAIGIRMRDGFQISAALNDSQVEQLLDAYYDNQLQIEELAASEVPRGSIFQSVAKEKALKLAFKLLCLTAQQDGIVRQLRGQDVVAICNTMPYRDMETTGQYTGSLIAGALGLKELDQEEDETALLDAEIA